MRCRSQKKNLPKRNEVQTQSGIQCTTPLHGWTSQKTCNVLQISRSLGQLTDITKSPKAILHKNRNGVVLRISD